MRDPRGRRLGAKCPIAKIASGEMPDYRGAVAIIRLYFRSLALGTISASDAKHGDWPSLGAGDVSNANDSIHVAKRSRVECSHPPPSWGRSRRGHRAAP